MAKRKSKLITDKELVDRIININHETHLNRTFIMELFGDFNDKSKKTVNPYDIITIPPGSITVNGIPNKNSFNTTVGLWVYNKLVMEPTVIDICGYINYTLSKKAYGKINAKIAYAILEDRLDIEKYKTFINYNEFLMPFVSILSPNDTRELINLSSKLETTRNKLIKENKENVPDWMEDVTMFDDVIQREKIKIAEQEIKDQEAKITAANEKLIENERYKSILYTQGDELADVVKDMIEQLFNIDLSEFTDVKKEDFAFKLDDKFVIGEVKGVTSQVTTQHLSQLDNHLTSFSEKNSVSEDDVIRLLIIDSQRKIPVAERVPVDQQQIDKAENKYGSLIIVTKEFLKMFEKFKNGDLNREACIDLINQKGILKID